MKRETLEMLERTTAFDDLDKAMLKELLPHMDPRHIAQLARVIRDHDARMEALKAKHGHREIQDWEAHLAEASAILSEIGKKDLRATPIKV
jgi:hypothetical protein